eukprot:766985-Hanusia_phi.AAC.5
MSLQKVKEAQTSSVEANVSPSGCDCQTDWVGHRTLSKPDRGQQLSRRRSAGERDATGGQDRQRQVRRYYSALKLISGASRWDKIAEMVPSRSKKEVIARVRDVKKKLSANTSDGGS